MSAPLQGKTIAFLATDGVEQIELTRPWKDLQGAGAELHLVTLSNEDIRAYHHLDKAHSFPSDKVVSEVTANDYDALILPGGVANPDALRQDEHALTLVREMVEAGKPVLAICHAPWVLIEADVVRGRRVTSYPSLRTDLVNAGAEWVDDELVSDRGISTSRSPDDLPAFCDALLGAIRGAD